MKTISLIVLGYGSIGKTFLDQLYNCKKKVEKDFYLKITVIGVYKSKTGITNIKGIKLSDLNNLDLINVDLSFNSLIKNINNPIVVIDTTASNETDKFLLKVLEQGGYAILANKKPLSGVQKRFNNLMKYENRLFFETTVGAGLPIVSTLKEIVKTGDVIESIEGCFSGTIGYITSMLDKKYEFSKAVLEAKSLGFTEPDPRDDLSGLDVARKALILSRLSFGSFNMNNILVKPLFPDNFASISVEKFVEMLPTLDKDYANKNLEANQRNKVLRYVAKIVPNKNVSVKLVKTDSRGDIGSLSGPDNIIVIKTKRYKNPLIIKGPGAGLEVTAAGVFGDLIKVFRCISN